MIEYIVTKVLGIWSRNLISSRTKSPVYWSYLRCVCVCVTSPPTWQPWAAELVEQGSRGLPSPGHHRHTSDLSTYCMLAPAGNLVLIRHVASLACLEFFIPSHVCLPSLSTNRSKYLWRPGEWRSDGEDEILSRHTSIPSDAFNFKWGI